MNGIIYKYTNKLNNKSYIGQTLHERERKKAHFIAQANSKFHKAIHYYGWINFDYIKLEDNIPQEQLSERELYWINYYDSINNGYNTKKRSCIDAIETKIIQKENGYHNKALPFGYEHRNKDGKIYIKENEANIIKNLFDDYSQGNISYPSLMNKYNLKYQSSVSNILKNNKYIGNEIFPQIINKELYDKVQKILNNSRKKPRKGTSCIINNIEYTSMTAAGKILGLSRRKIKRLIKEQQNN